MTLPSRVKTQVAPGGSVRIVTFCAELVVNVAHPEERSAAAPTASSAIVARIVRLVFRSGAPMWFAVVARHPERHLIIRPRPDRDDNAKAHCHGRAAPIRGARPADRDRLSLGRNVRSRSSVARELLREVTPESRRIYRELEAHYGARRLELLLEMLDELAGSPPSQPTIRRQALSLASSSRWCVW